jgi:hypothetical protein
MILSDLTAPAEAGFREGGKPASRRIKPGASFFGIMP